MNKDALLATIIGFGIGIVITVVILFTPNIGKYFPNIHFPSLFGQTKNNVTQKKDTKDVKGATTFAVESPTEDAIVNKAMLLVSGTAQDGSVVIIEGQLNEKVVNPKDGKFAGEITLAEGKNSITITNYQKNTPQSKTIIVYYTEETF